ncbi:MAG: hypothetical protein K8R77_08590 [Anaerolineaceae bacterium]|nr:hypothetical protein [Anaerolineaceae bacterium]
MTKLTKLDHWYTKINIMKDELFAELVANVKEDGAISRGEKAPAQFQAGTR